MQTVSRVSGKNVVHHHKIGHMLVLIDILEMKPFRKRAHLKLLHVHNQSEL